MIFSIPLIMRLFRCFILVLLCFSCEKETNSPEVIESNLMFGGDFSISKKIQDNGYAFYAGNNSVDSPEVFYENGYTWARYRIFHSPNGEGAVCNDLEYTKESIISAKQAGFKILLDFHYSDTWADPGKQFKPAAWENLSFPVLQDSVKEYTTKVIANLKSSSALPDLVQVGNEIDNGMLWPDGGIDSSEQSWQKLTTLIKAGIEGVKQEEDLPIMIHAATGGDSSKSLFFYNKMQEYQVNFDIIGISYYPWWHGTFEDLEANLSLLSREFDQEISLVETAYYQNGYYPEQGLASQPYPSSPQGQLDYLIALKNLLEKYPKVESVYYWQPDSREAPATDIFYMGRSLFDANGKALPALGAWK